MYSIAKPNKLKYLYLVTFKFNDSNSDSVSTVYESDNKYVDFLKTDLKAIKNSINMSRPDSVEVDSVYFLDNNYINAY